jgi:hypothetical protein
LLVILGRCHALTTALALPRARIAALLRLKLALELLLLGLARLPRKHWPDDQSEVAELLTTPEP